MQFFSRNRRLPALCVLVVTAMGLLMAGMLSLGTGHALAFGTKAIRRRIAPCVTEHHRAPLLIADDQC
ncbi:hypothetical protein ABBQ38_001793 [Trebouxia sp. C0009 RCD-2024]